MHDVDATRRSWNIATRNHNVHKGDQVAFLRGGGDTLFPEEVELLGSLAGKRLVHLQCNAGQDSLCLARRGAIVTGVDLLDEAIAFAQGLAAGTGIAARFVESEVVTWLSTTSERFDVAFASYGVAGWLPDLGPWARGIARVLEPGGRLVYVEFHPVVWSVGADLRLAGDDYFAREPFVDPVNDYVAASGPGLLPAGALVAAAPAAGAPPTEANAVPAQSWQHTLGTVVSALADAGLVLETLREYPYANGCKVNAALVLGEGRRWEWPAGTARVPLMFGLSMRRP